MRKIKRDEEERVNKEREREREQAREPSLSPPSFSLPFSKPLTFAAGCDTSISRRMALPSLVSTMPGEEVWSFGGFEGEKGLRGKRAKSVAGAGGKKKSIARAPLLAPIPPFVPDKLTSGRVQEHLEHRARAQRGADDVGDGLIGVFLRGRLMEGRREGLERHGMRSVSRSRRKEQHGARRALSGRSLRAFAWTSRTLAAMMLPNCAFLPDSRLAPCVNTVMGACIVF